MLPGFEAVRAYFSARVGEQQQREGYPASPSAKGAEQLQSQEFLPTVEQGILADL